MSQPNHSTPSAMSVQILTAITALENYLGLTREDEKEEEISPAHARKKLIDLLHAWKVKLEGPDVLSSADIDFEVLKNELAITPAHSLRRNGNFEDRVADSIAQGGETYMTSESMYRHLNMLENLVSDTSGARGRLWIDAIFFRVAAMVSGHMPRMALNLEQHLPSVDIPRPGQRSLRIKGTVNYTALMSNAVQHESFIQSSELQYIAPRNPNILFIKAKPCGLAGHVPQAVAEMYASAKYLNKNIVRGTITSGHEWIFIVFYLNENGIGGIYAKSPSIKIQVTDVYPYSVCSPGPDIIAGILSYWIERSFVDLDENDWFCK